MVVMKEHEKNGRAEDWLVGHWFLVFLLCTFKYARKEEKKIKLIFLFSFSYPFNVLRQTACK